MRERKFRAYGISIIGEHIQIRKLYYWKMGDNFDGRLLVKDMAYIEFNTVSEWTGLQDNRSVDIYEGDTVRIRHPHKGREWTGRVVWDGYMFNGKGFYFPHFDNPSDLFSEGTKYIEILNGRGAYIPSDRNDETRDQAADQE